MYQCAEKDRVDYCSNPIASRPLDSSGCFATAATVQKTFTDEFGVSVQCITNCRVVVWDLQGRTGEHGITFTK